MIEIEQFIGPSITDKKFFRS